jgi:3-hydroxyisobutyrate dehydrogenase-like beta-hydroxyacid dehydrogenase
VNQNTEPFAAVIRDRAAETGAVPLDAPSELPAAADVVVSCVTGSSALDVARTLAPALGRGQLYVDVNTTRPEVQEQAAALVEGAGGVYVDAAMLGGIPATLHKVPILASGSGAARFKELMEPYGMLITVMEGGPGKASGVKMMRSIFQKGLLALLVEMLDSADRLGVADVVLDSVVRSMDSKPFMDLAQMIVTKGVVGAGRMIHEMEEVALTEEQVGGLALMPRASAKVLEWCDCLGLRDKLGGGIPGSIDEVLAAFREARSA